MAANMHSTTVGALDLVPATQGPSSGWRVYNANLEIELGSILCDPTTFRWFVCLEGGFPASAPSYRNPQEALDALKRMTGPASQTPPLYARMTLAQLEADEEVILRNYPTVGSESSRDTADLLLSLIDAQKRMIRESQVGEAMARR